MKEYHLRITTPAGDVFDGAVTQLSVRGIMGDLAIMAGHIPFVTTLKDTENNVRVYLADKEIKTATCTGGLLTVSKESVQLLATEIRWQ